MKQDTSPIFQKLNQERRAREIHIAYRPKLGWLDKFALFVTKQVGTMGFFFVIALWTLLWIMWNAFAPINLRFDPYPAFVLWIFVSNVLQLFFLPLIMVGQNLQSRHSEARAERDLEIDVKSEKEIEAILLLLESHQDVLQRILERVGGNKKESD